MSHRSCGRARLAQRLAITCMLALTLSGAPAAQAAPQTKEAASAEIQQVAAYAVMAKHFPAEYAKVLDVVVTGLNSGRRFNDIVLEINPIVVELVLRQAPMANVENTLASIRLTRAQAKAMEAIDPKLCLVLLGSATSDRAIGLDMPPELLEQELALTANLLRQTALAPEPVVTAPLPDGVLEDIAVTAYDALPGDQLRVAMREIEGDPTKASTALQQTAFCEFSVAMFDVLLKMPPVEAVRTFKAMTVSEPES